MHVLPPLERQPDPDRDRRPALIFPDRTLSYGQLRAHAAHLALALRERTGAQGRVAILAEARIETAVAVVAALIAGRAAIPVNPRSGPAELGHVVQDAAPDLVLLAADAQAPAGLRDRPSLRVDLARTRPGLSPDELGPAPGPDAAALIVYTSGTTGPPKGSLMPRRAISSNLDGLAEVWRWTAEDVVAHGLPLFHVHGLVLGVLGPLRRGGAVRHIGRFSPDAVREALTAAGDDPRASMLFGVPTMYRRLAEAAESDAGLREALRRARLLVSGSAALPAAEHERLGRLTGRPIIERYGMTETLMNTAVAIDDAPAPGTVGRAVPGVQLRLRDDDGSIIDADDDATIGEVQVRGPNVFLGYLNRPEATAAVLDADGWFSTGDMATRTATGAIRLVGRRATDLIKSGGYKIGAGEIEACLREHPAVLDAAVTGEPDDDLGERIIAWIVLRDEAPPEARVLIDHVADQLAPHKRPREVRFLHELPRNEMGKVVKPRLSGR